MTFVTLPPRRVRPRGVGGLSRAGGFPQCGAGTLRVVYPDDVRSAGVRAEDPAQSVDAPLRPGAPGERLRTRPGVAGFGRKPGVR